MIKNFKKGRYLLYFLMLAAALQSCMRDYEISESEKEAQIEKFQMFALNKKKSGAMMKSGNDMSYQYAFRDLYYQYYNLHPELAPDFDNPATAVPDFRFATQLFTEPDSSRTALFPMVESKQVTGLLVAKIDKNESFLEFYKADLNSVTNPILLAFSQAYTQNGVMSKNGNDDDEPFPPGWIEEVIINVPPKPVEWPLDRSDECDDLTDYVNNGCSGPPPSTCTDYQNCDQLPIGGSTFPPADPCSNMKTVGKHAKTKELLKDLDSKKNTLKPGESMPRERGHFLSMNADGTVNEHYVEGEMGKLEIEVSLPNGKYDAYIHSHFKGGLSVFSVSDLAVLAAMYKNGFIRNVNTFVMGVVTSSNTKYMITINNEAQFSTFAATYLSTNNQFTEKDKNNQEFYYDLLGISPENNNETFDINEQKFLAYLETQSSGLTIFKSTDDNFDNWFALVRNSNGTVQAKQCSN
ncbi:hypothetical protein [Chryseobacterium sp. MFBS3-17]|uniref:hypothetical protein n=1 Tax=Chryseobacterium sp. MFBS3-17 TaxID=2886689 RepID=UPI001D0DEC55|nr:hypothetical protein [Chryseobacterium sp. MFBS3-17]MCC2591734.1 hypothetical protein [Chryseobacterium sp. MFBS3-17]